MSNPSPPAVVSNVAQPLGTLMKHTVSRTDKFLNMMKDFNVIGFALAIIITSNIRELSDAFIDGIILPTIDPFLSKFSNEKSYIKIGPISIQYHKFITALVKFVVLSVLIFIILEFGVNITKPITWVSVRSAAPGVKLA